MRCPRCGAVSPEGTAECPSCGRKLPVIAERKSSENAGLVAIIVAAVLLTVLLAASFIVRLAVALMVSVLDAGTDVSLPSVLALIGSSGFAVLGALVVAGLLAIVSTVLIVVACVKLQKGDRDLSARIVFADYVVLVLAALLFTAFTATGGLGIVRAVATGLATTWSWLLLGVCCAVAIGLCYRLFFKER